MRGGRPPLSSRAIADCVVPTQLGELALREPARGAPLGHLARDRGEEPALLRSRQSRPQALERQRRRSVSRIAYLRS